MPNASSEGENIKHPRNNRLTECMRSIEGATYHPGYAEPLRALLTSSKFLLVERLRRWSGALAAIALLRLR